MLQHRDHWHRFYALAVMLLTALVVVACLQCLDNVRSPFWLFLPAVLLGFETDRKPQTYWHAAWVGLCLALLGQSTARLVSLVSANLRQPPEWDFLCFWLPGKVATQGLNVYRPEYAQQLAQPFHPSAEFTQAILDVGFWYPPPTLWLFAPLGWFEVHTAIAVWYVVQFAALCGAIVLLWQGFQPAARWRGLLFTGVMVLTIEGTLTTVFYAQTNFLVLFMLLLFWRDRANPWGGLWLTLGMVIKPFLVFFLPYLLLRQYWRTVFSTVMASTAVVLLTLAVFGSNTFLSYFKHTGRAALPPFVYTETVNQSLLAGILRLTHYDFSHTTPFTQPLFLLVSLLLLGCTAWLVCRLSQRDDDLALVLTLLLALLLYPAALAHYNVLLLVPLFYLGAAGQPVQSRRWAIGLLTLVYLLLSRQATLLATLLLWCLFAAIATRHRLQAAAQPRSAR